MDIYMELQVGILFSQLLVLGFSAWVSFRCTEIIKATSLNPFLQIYHGKQLDCLSNIYYLLDAITWSVYEWSKTLPETVDSKAYETLYGGSDKVKELNNTVFRNALFLPRGFLPLMEDIYDSLTDVIEMRSGVSRDVILNLVKEIEEKQQLILINICEATRVLESRELIKRENIYKRTT